MIGYRYTVTYSDDRHTYDFWFTPKSEEPNGYQLKVETANDKDRGVTYYAKNHLEQLSNKQWTIHYPELLPEDLFEL